MLPSEWRGGKCSQIPVLTGHMAIAGRNDVTFPWQCDFGPIECQAFCGLRNEFELNSICHDPERLAKIRTRF